MRQLRVYGWRGWENAVQVRFTCMSPTRAAIERLIGRRIDPNGECFCETGNAIEIANAKANPPMTIFYQADREGVFRISRRNPAATSETEVK